MKSKTLEERMVKRISRKRGDAFVRADFEDIGGYDQVGRVLRRMVGKGWLVRVGQGLYVRARPSITDGEPIPARGPAEPCEENLLCKTPWHLYGACSDPKTMPSKE